MERRSDLPFLSTREIVLLVSGGNGAGKGFRGAGANKFSVAAPFLYFLVEITKQLVSLRLILKLQTCTQEHKIIFNYGSKGVQSF